MESMEECIYCPALFHENFQLEDHDLQCHTFACRSCPDRNFTHKDEFIDHFFSLHFNTPFKATKDIAVQCDLMKSRSEKLPLLSNLKHEDVDEDEVEEGSTANWDTVEADFTIGMQYVKCELKSDDEESRPVTSEVKDVLETYKAYAFPKTRKKKTKKVTYSATRKKKVNVKQERVVVKEEVRNNRLKTKAKLSDDEDIKGPFSCTECVFQTTCPETFQIHKQRHTVAERVGKNSFSPIILKKAGVTKLDCETAIQIEVEKLKSDDATNCSMFLKFGLHKQKAPSKKDLIPWKRVLTAEDMEGKTIDEIQTMQRSCPVCNQFFPRITSLKHHVSMIHNAEDVKLDIVQNMRVCEICAENVPWGSYKMHVKKHNMTRSHVCPKCNRGFFLPSRLKSHLANTRCSSNTLVCSYCAKTFLSTAGLHYHIHTEHELTKRHLQKVSCSICKKELHTTASLRTHIRLVHHNEQFRVTKICTECGKKLRGNAALEDHVNSYHSRQWSYVCKICRKHFSQKRQAYRHHKVHHQQKVQDKSLEEYYHKVPWIDTTRNKKNRV